MVAGEGWLGHGTPEGIALVHVDRLTGLLNLLDNLVYAVDEEHDSVTGASHVEGLPDRVLFVEHDTNGQRRLGATDGFHDEGGNFTALPAAQVVILADDDPVEGVGGDDGKLLDVGVAAVARGCDHGYLAPGPHGSHGGLYGAHGVGVVAVVDDDGGLTVWEQIEAARRALLIGLEGAQAEADHVEGNTGSPASGGCS